MSLNLEIINFKTLGDESGSLVALEGLKNIPFEIKRVYYIFGTKNGVRRGFHAHRELRQVIISIAGNCDILMDDGLEKSIVSLNRNDSGLIIEPMVWHEMYNFSENCVLMVLANDYYTESDYIRDYSEFIRLI